VTRFKLSLYAMKETLGEILRAADDIEGPIIETVEIGGNVFVPVDLLKKELSMPLVLAQAYCLDPRGIYESYSPKPILGVLTDVISKI
jgi:hypothetical protein